MWTFTSTGGLPDLLNTPNGRCGGFLHFALIALWSSSCHHPSKTESLRGPKVSHVDRWLFCRVLGRV
jgi:hypothetical protein